MSCCGAFAFILRLQPALAWLALPPPPPPPPPPPCHLHHNIDSTWPPVPASTMSTARSPTARNTFRCTRDPAREKYGTASFTEKYSKDSRTATTSPRSAARRVASLRPTWNIFAVQGSPSSPCHGLTDHSGQLRCHQLEQACKDLSAVEL